MAAISVVKATYPGATLTFAAASGGGDYVQNPSKAMVLLVRNDDGSAKTVTVAVPGNTWNGVATPDTAVSVPAGEERAILLSEAYADTNRQAQVTYSATTSVTVACVSAT